MRAIFISGLEMIGCGCVRSANAINEIRFVPLHGTKKSARIKVRSLAALVAAGVMTFAHPFEAKAGGYYYDGNYAPAYYQPYDYYGYGYGDYGYAAFTWPFFWTVPPDGYCHQRVRIYDNWGGWVWGQRIVC